MSLVIKWAPASRMVMFRPDYWNDYAKVATVT
jgi:hypothetical protein